MLMVQHDEREQQPAKNGTRDGLAFGKKQKRDGTDQCCGQFGCEWQRANVLTTITAFAL
jgi:hypothetical protein